MDIKRLGILSTLFISALIPATQAKAVDLSIGGGYPFFVIPEMSIATDDAQRRWFANYKMGLDDGFSIGVEQGLDEKNTHAVGMMIGALGVRDDKRPCPAQNNNSGDVLEEIGNTFAHTLGCAIGEAFDDKSTDGIGVSYSYNFNGLNNAGMRIRVELGYGKASGSDEKRADGGIVFSYQF